MIIEGGSRRGATWFAGHLMRQDAGQTVRIAEARGLAGHDIPSWFRQMEAVSFGTRCENYFYHANINPREDEPLTEAQWGQAIDALEHNLGLDGHSRFVVEHSKADGRTHRHVFWSRIDPDTMTAVSDSKTYRIHERTADELEKLFGHQPTPRGHDVADRNPHNWEVFRGKEGIDPYDVSTELTALWRQADNGQAFASALSEHGYFLAKGDRRDFVVVDRNGDDHSLARRISGATAKDVRARMAGVDRNALPTVQAARELARERADGTEDAAAPDTSHKAHRHDSSALFAEVAEELLHAVKEKRKSAQEQPLDPVAEAANEPTPFERAAEELAQAARETSSSEPLATEFERVASEAKDAMRSSEGEGFMFAAGLAWIARQLKQSFAETPPSRERTLFERVVDEAKQAARENAGEPCSADGESFWQRGVALIADAYERTSSWLHEKAQGFVGRLFQNRNSDRDDPGLER